MKAILMTALLGVSSAWGMSGFPDGDYAGHGRWKDTGGAAGQYTLTTAIRDNVVTSKYEFDGQEREWIFTAETDSSGFFNVLSEGRKVGKGYCYSVQCHYEVQVGKMTLEETLTFTDGKLYRLGSKEVAGNRIAWEESLQ